LLNFLRTLINDFGVVGKTKLRS